jgi:hypothetical protein
VGVVVTLALASARADVGSDTTRGYNGSGAARGYNGSGAARGYNGSGAARGYNGSGAARGYNGSGAARGYNGSGAARGYNGSGAARGYNGSGAARAYNAADCTFGAGFSVAVMGPIESISTAGDTSLVTVLGQAFEVYADGSLGVGDYVVAAQDPELGAIVYPVGAPYVPGVSAVKVKAEITRVDSALGTLAVGTTAVDYTPILSIDPTFAPSVGDVFEGSGIQADSKGVVLAGPSIGPEVGCSAEDDGRM